MRTLRLSLVIVLVLMVVVTTWVSTSIAGSGFTQLGITPGPTIDPFSPNPTPMPCQYYYYWAALRVSFLPDADDAGSGYDWTAAVARRTNGAVTSVWYYQSRTSSTFISTLSHEFILGRPGVPFTGTAWLEVYDITYAAVQGSAPVSEFSRIIANAPTSVIRVQFNAADYLAPGCVTDTGAAGNDSIAPLPSDERLNWQHGDLLAVVYAASDSGGVPAMHVYSVNADSQGTFLASVTQADLAPYRDAPPPAANTVIKTLGENVTLYRLTSGEFALVIGPDSASKNWQIIFDNIPWTYLKHAQFDPGA